MTVETTSDLGSQINTLTTLHPLHLQHQGSEVNEKQEDESLLLRAVPVMKITGSGRQELGFHRNEMKSAWNSVSVLPSTREAELPRDTRADAAGQRGARNGRFVEGVRHRAFSAPGLHYITSSKLH